MRLRTLILIAALFLAGPLAAQQKTTVILVRHAEKAAEGGNDPSLSAEGRERALALAAELADDGVDAIVVTPLVRTKQTAEPVARARSVQPRVVPLDGGLQAHAAAVRDAVAANAGHTILIVGHSNTVPALVAALGGPTGISIGDAEYGNLFILTLEEGHPAVFARSCYGAADPSGACAAQQPALPKIR